MAKYKFVEGLPKFQKSLEHIVKKFDLEEKQIWKELSVLTEHPQKALRIPGFNTLRKLRLPIPGRTGKRGGLRFICSVIKSKKVIIPVDIYAKSEQEDLSNKEYKDLIKELEEFLKS